MSEIYTHQAAATRRFGIEFRSKLEAEWAYALTNKQWRWDYVDSPWYDFRLLDADRIPLEVKPDGQLFIVDALRRVPAEQSEILLAVGSPERGMICYAVRSKIQFWVSIEQRFWSEYQNPADMVSDLRLWHSFVLDIRKKVKSAMAYSARIEIWEQG